MTEKTKAKRERYWMYALEPTSTQNSSFEPTGETFAAGGDGNKLAGNFGEVLKF